MMAAPRVLIMMADYGHDPTETAVPYTRMRDAGFEISFATENGEAPECDRRMLQGLTQKLLGASKPAVDMYGGMARSEEWLHPLAWSAPGFSLDQFDLVLFPGGHEKSVRQIIDSDTVHRLVAEYFPKTRKPGAKAVAAVCHGVMVLSESKDTNGHSIIRDCITTTLPSGYEKLAFWGTRAFLGAYYKTYGASSEDVEQSIRKNLAHPSQLRNTLLPTPFVVEDEKHNYVSARWPGDAELFAEKIVKMVKNLNQT